MKQWTRWQDWVALAAGAYAPAGTDLDQTHHEHRHLDDGGAGRRDGARRAVVAVPSPGTV